VGGVMEAMQKDLFNSAELIRKHYPRRRFSD
jgi:hypothetical protein